MTCALALGLAPPALGGATNAAARPAAYRYVGVCSSFGGLTAGFQPRVTAVPGSIGLSVTGSASCSGNAGSSTMSVNLSGSALMSCHAALGSMFGTLSWNSGTPAPKNVSVTVTGTAGALHLVLTAVDFDADAELEWSAADAALCPVSGTPGTQLSGTVAFVSG